MLNNKGQSLVLFVIVLPILLLIVILVIDIGKALVLKQELKNISNIVLDYWLDNLDKEEIKFELVNLVELNNNEIDNVNINIDDSKIYIKLNENVKGTFSGIIDISIFNVETSYVGYIKDNNKVIERISGWLIWILLWGK